MSSKPANFLDSLIAYQLQMENDDNFNMDNLTNKIILEQQKEEQKKKEKQKKKEEQQIWNLFNLSDFFIESEFSFNILSEIPK